MATLGLSKVFILDKYFTELQKFWETEKKLQEAPVGEAAVLQRRLLSLSSELLSLRTHLHAAPAPAPAPAAPSPPPRPPHAPPPRLAAAAPAPAHAPALAPAPRPPPDDLVHLRGPLTEDALIKALQTRFHQNKFYVWCGPVLVAVNGYTDPGNPLTLSGARAHGRPELARLATDAVRAQADTGYPQAIILSGVSGSGKTYASMQLLRLLFETAGGGAETDAFKHLAAAFTVLRSLGTAHTPHNSNSSRIGQFIEVQVTDGALYRTKIHCYFLEQTRVVRAPPHETNYHIFYQLLAGLTAEERHLLHLDQHSPHTLRYLQPPPHHRVDVDHAARFQAWKSCLGILGIPFMDVVRVLAAVLLLGNVQLEEGEGGGVRCAARCEPELAACGALLGVGGATLLRGLCARRPPARHASPAAPPPPPSALAATSARDALAKALYCRTVATIVRRANSLKRLGSTLGTLSSDSSESVHGRRAAAAAAAGASSMAALNDAVRHATDGFVGILDMFGFEDASPARLEHLCVNLCAETMQHFYNTHMFKSSVESCREEGVECALEVEYVDNVPCIDLVSSLRGGLLAALDAECAVGGGAPAYVARVTAAHRHSPRLLTTPRHPTRFTVRHYAADVTYDATDFLDANRDVVPDDLVAVFDKRGCEFGFATHLWGSELRALEAAGGARGAQFRASPSAPAAAAPHRALRDEPATTLTQDFHTRLDNLLRTLVHARPHFVRCVRANASEAPLTFDRGEVARQLRALHTLETVTLMAGGYPHRMRFRAFMARYRALAPREDREREGGEACEAVLAAVAARPGPGAGAAGRREGAPLRHAVGKRHVFLSEGMRQALEGGRAARRRSAALAIQAAWRAHRRRAVAVPAVRAPLRPRPQPIAGTPPPDPPDKCDPALVRQTCTLLGLDLEVPPPLPPARAYTVSGGLKLCYPQRRVVRCEWTEGEATVRAGQLVTVVGAGRRGHLAARNPANPHGPLLHLPYRVLHPPHYRPHPPHPPHPAPS